jgi:hypothetical protein
MILIDMRLTVLTGESGGDEIGREERKASVPIIYALVQVRRLSDIKG